VIDLGLPIARQHDQRKGGEPAEEGVTGGAEEKQRTRNEYVEKTY